MIVYSCGVQPRRARFWRRRRLECALVGVEIGRCGACAARGDVFPESAYIAMSDGEQRALLLGAAKVKVLDLGERLTLLEQACYY